MSAQAFLFLNPQSHITSGMWRVMRVLGKQDITEKKNVSGRRPTRLLGRRNRIGLKAENYGNLAA